jgi:putative membrane protein
MMRDIIIVVLKGAGMGAANVIPGVSGGTIALITGVFERLINAIKSFDLTAIRFILKGKFKEFVLHTDFYFVLALVLGMIIALFSLARILGYLFSNYPVYIWSYFFGLIMASVYFVGQTVEKWKLAVIISFLIGATIAVFIFFLKPAEGNENFFYLLLCGVAGISSMILPGLSGSFILILMGNYLLVLDAVNNFRFDILLPAAIGIVFGLIGFSHLLSWVYKKFRNQTIALLTGFILGSLLIIWPWKEKIFATNALGEMLLKNGDPIIARYELALPVSFTSEVLIAFTMMVLGIMSIWLIEWAAKRKSS